MFFLFFLKNLEKYYSFHKNIKQNNRSYHW